jgi:hypothetical protein
MAGTRQNNTFEEALHRMLGDLTQMKVLPDADLPWIIDLETQIVGKIREPIDRMQAATQAPPPGSPGMPPMAGGMPPGPGGGLPPDLAAMLPPPPPGGPGNANTQSLPPMPSNPDEFRRIVGNIPGG